MPQGPHPAASSVLQQMIKSLVDNSGAGHPCYARGAAPAGAAAPSSGAEHAQNVVNNEQQRQQQRRPPAATSAVSGPPGGHMPESPLHDAARAAGNGQRTTFATATPAAAAAAAAAASISDVTALRRAIQEPQPAAAAASAIGDLVSPSPFVPTPSSLTIISNSSSSSSSSSASTDPASAAATGAPHPTAAASSSRSSGHTHGPPLAAGGGTSSSIVRSLPRGTPEHPWPVIRGLEASLDVNKNKNIIINTNNDNNNFASATQRGFPSFPASHASSSRGPLPAGELPFAPAEQQAASPRRDGLGPDQQQQQQPRIGSQRIVNGNSGTIREASISTHASGFVTPLRQPRESASSAAFISPDPHRRAEVEDNAQRFNMAGLYHRGGSTGIDRPAWLLRAFMQLCGLYWLVAAVLTWMRFELPLVTFFAGVPRMAFQDDITAGFAFILCLFMSHAASSVKTVPIACASYFCFGTMMLLIAGSANLAVVTRGKRCGFLTLHVMHAALFFVKACIMLLL
jgi:hypothetical protein